MKTTFKAFKLMKLNCKSGSGTITENQRAVKIRYGSDDDAVSSISPVSRTHEYTFRTPAELRTFIMGVNEAVRYFALVEDYRVLNQSEIRAGMEYHIVATPTKRKDEIAAD